MIPDCCSISGDAYGAVSSSLSLVGLALCTLVVAFSFRPQSLGHNSTRILSMVAFLTIFGMLLAGVRQWLGIDSMADTNAASGYRIALTFLRVTAGILLGWVIWMEGSGEHR